MCEINQLLTPSWIKQQILDAIRKILINHTGKVRVYHLGGLHHDYHWAALPKAPDIAIRPKNRVTCDNIRSGQYRKVRERLADLPNIAVIK
jgi:hypothetical protein